MTYITGDAETARTIYDQIIQQSQGLIIYTDGSTINGKVRESAVQNDLPVSKQMFLGRTPEASVFIAELVGIHMALEIALHCMEREVTIFSDSHAAIQAIGGTQTAAQQILGLVAER